MNHCSSRTSAFFRMGALCFGLLFFGGATAEVRVTYLDNAWNVDPIAVSNSGFAFCTEDKIWRNGVGLTSFLSSYSRATGISDFGVKVSFYNASGSSVSAHVWSNGAETYLDQGYAHCISSWGQVVGGEYLDGRSGTHYAVRWLNSVPLNFLDHDAVVAVSADGNQLALREGYPDFSIYRSSNGETPQFVGEPRPEGKVASITDNGTIFGHHKVGTQAQAFAIAGTSYTYFLESYNPSFSNVISTTNIGGVVLGTIVSPSFTGRFLWSATTGLVSPRAMFAGLDIADPHTLGDPSVMSRNGRTFTGYANRGFEFGSVYVLTLDSIRAVAQRDNYQIDEDTVLSLTGEGVLANDLSFYGSQLRAELVESSGVGFLNLGTGGGVLYIPPADFNGPVTFRYRVAVPGETSSPVTVTINVVAVNDAPTIAAPASFTAFVSQHTGFSGISVDDVDSSPDNVLVTLEAQHGILTFNGQGRTVSMTGSLFGLNQALANLSYISDPGYSGQDTITVTANDLGHNGSGGPQITTRVIPITVNPRSPQSVYPASSATLLGELFSGSVGDLQVSDDQRMLWLNDPGSLVCQVEFTAVEPFDQISECIFGAEVGAGRAGLVIELLLYDFFVGRWQSWGFVAPTSDTGLQARVYDDASHLIGPNHQIKARIRWQPVNDDDPTQDGWFLSLDWCRWRLTPYGKG